MKSIHWYPSCSPIHSDLIHWIVTGTAINYYFMASRSHFQHKDKFEAIGCCNVAQDENPTSRCHIELANAELYESAYPWPSTYHHECSLHGPHHIRRRLTLLHAPDFTPETVSRRCPYWYSIGTVLSLSVLSSCLTPLPTSCLINL